MLLVVEERCSVEWWWLGSHGAMLRESDGVGVVERIEQTIDEKDERDTRVRNARDACLRCL